MHDAGLCTAWWWRLTSSDSFLVCAYTIMCMCIHKPKHVHTQTYSCVVVLSNCMHVCVYACMYACMHVCTCCSYYPVRRSVRTLQQVFDNQQLTMTRGAQSIQIGYGRRMHTFTPVCAMLSRAKVHKCALTHDIIASGASSHCCSERIQRGC